jgi:hypothetical protein
MLENTNRNALGNEPQPLGNPSMRFLIEMAVMPAAITRVPSESAARVLMENTEESGSASASSRVAIQALAFHQPGGRVSRHDKHTTDIKPGCFVRPPAAQGMSLVAIGPGKMGGIKNSAKTPRSGLNLANRRHKVASGTTTFCKV